MTEDWHNYDWSDLKPLPIESPQANLAAIDYSDEYRDALSYFRAVYDAQEKSERALALTATCIDLNPAHYSVWDYRFEILEKIGRQVFSLDESLTHDVEPLVRENRDWINMVSLDNPKNYQVWNYRQHLETPNSPEYYKQEISLVKLVLQDDPKNFHAWSHLKWVVSRAVKHKVPLDLNWPDSLVKFVEALLDQDVFNNSVWSFRYFILHTIWPDAVSQQDDVEFVKNQIDVAPENDAAWNYLVAVAPKETQIEISRKFRSPRAVEVEAEATSDKEEAVKLYKLLLEIQPFRKGFWNYKLSLLNGA